jgi:hypothetical protein
VSTVIGLVAGLALAAITSLLTYLTTVAKTRLDLAVEYDKDLRKGRLDAYLKLWPMLKPLARYSAPGAVTYKIVKDTSENMRDWYFDVGGVYLSQESRTPYFALKGKMQELIDDNAMQEQDGPLPDDKVTELRKGASELRVALSNDIGTRQGSFLGSPWLKGRRAKSTEPALATSGAD